eukprot:1245222-Amphidinium_carterae.1
MVESNLKGVEYRKQLQCRSKQQAADTCSFKHRFCSIVLELSKLLNMSKAEGTKFGWSVADQCLEMRTKKCTASHCQPNMAWPAALATS